MFFFFLIFKLVRWILFKLDKWNTELSTCLCLMAYFFIVLASLLLLSCKVRNFETQLTREHVQRKSCIGWVEKKVCAKSLWIPQGVFVLAVIIAQSMTLLGCIWLQVSSLHTIQRITKQSGIRSSEQISKYTVVDIRSSHFWDFTKDKRERNQE